MKHQWAGKKGFTNTAFRDGEDRPAMWRTHPDFPDALPVKVPEEEAVGEILRLAEENAALKEAAGLVAKGFADGVFVRDISLDSEPGWALRLAEPLRGLGMLAKLTDTKG